MDLGGWLRGLGLGEYETNFRDNKIDAELLPRLTDAGLKDIGVSALGDRLRLLDAIAALAQANPLVNGAASSSKAAALKAEESAERRPITVMFCDLVGSTELAAKLDPEDWRNLLNSYLDEASTAVTALGGHVLKKLGDGLMALFGYPQAQENDAERAVRAALAIQRALAEINVKNCRKGVPELSARIGLECGPVVVEATGEVFGDAPNVAARVQTAATPGSVLVTTNVQRLVVGLFVAEEQGAKKLKGLPEPVQLFRIVRASGGGRRGGARALTPFIGREEELSVLARHWERARKGEGQLVLIVGEPGIGKSRLIEEFRSKLTETPHTWSEWSASQLLQNTPLHPIAEWGRQRFGMDAPAEQRLADLENTLRLVGLDPVEYAPLIAPLVDIALLPERAANFAPEELRRRQLAAMTAFVLAGARSQPVVIAFEDLHWADPTSLDLLRALADRGAQAPLLLLATARPGFRPPWSLRSHHSLISLSPLDRAGVARMIGEISAQHALSKDVIEGVNERTGGVPLFVEEVMRLLLERGEQASAQAIPPTLQQSLAARLDRLGPAREVAQIGAVLGRDFTYGLLRNVGELGEPALQASLERLADADLLFVEGAPPIATYRFKHALIQDAAFDSLLRSRRQALHRRAAEILRDDPERAAVEHEVIAHHFTQAGLDDLAIEWWGKAGDEALRRSAFQEAIAHLGKAIAMADRTGGVAWAAAGDAAALNRSRLKLQIDYGQAMMFSKGYGAEETQAAFADALKIAVETADPAGRFDAYFGIWAGSLDRGDLAQARQIAETFRREAGDEAYAPSLARACVCLGSTIATQGDPAGARAHLEEALKIYDPGWHREAKLRFGSDVGVLATSYLAEASWLLGDVGQAQELIDQAVAGAIQSQHATTEGFICGRRALLEAVRGDVEAVLSLTKTMVKLSQDHGITRYVAWGKMYHGWATARLGDRGAGVSELQEGLTDLTDQGSKFNVPLYQALLAEIEAEMGERALSRIDGALALARETGEHWSDSLLHRIRGEILLRLDPANRAAEQAFRDAIAVAQAQGARSLELQAALGLAKLYQSTARAAGTREVLACALAGFSPTAEMPEIAEAQALLERLGRGADGAIPEKGRAT